MGVLIYEGEVQRKIEGVLGEIRGQRMKLVRSSGTDWEIAT